MKREVRRIKLNENNISQTTGNKGINNDLILVNDYHCPVAEGEPFKSDANTAILYEKGWVDIKVNMQPYHIKAPAMLFVLANEILEYGNQSTDMQSKVIVMSNQFIQSLQQNSNINQTLAYSLHNNPIIDLTKHELEIYNQYYDSLEKIVDYQENPYRLETAKHLTLAMYYGYSHSIHKNEKKSPHSRREEIVNDFFELLKYHHKRERNLQFYADSLYITVKHLSFTVRSVTGKSASRWIDEYVVTESKALLRSTKMSIKEISIEMGFEDQSLFGKYFKRTAGVSPSEYRKK